MGEPQKVTLTVTAHNAADGATQNYAGSFAKLDATTLGTGANWFNTGCAVGTQCMGLGAMNPGASSGTGLSGRLSVSTGPGNPSSSWVSGVGTFSAHIVLSRNSTPDGPYGTLKFGAAPQDSDGVVLPSPSSSDTHKMDFDATEGNTLASNPDSTNERRLLFTTKGYFGRLWLGNAYGSDQKSLSVPYETQYWNGFVFVRNTADSLVPFALGNVSLNTVLGTPPTLTLGSFASGSGTLGLSAPGVPGTVDVYVNLGSTGSQANCPGYAVGTSAGRTYLSGKWCGSNYDRDPVSRATFGVQAGKRGPIYIRENY
jgi:MSHA biogenesis protein MshQ